MIKTPEYYGAIGDGITDDTIAWQRAVDSGEPVTAGSAKYKCGTITITSNVDIDCGNAEFICTSDTLFDCHGSISQEYSGNDYTANQSGYTIQDSFTGIVWLSGTNNIFRQRSYYMGGSVEYFANGVMQTKIPIPITGVTIHELQPITVSIKNVKNVEFTNTENAVVVKMQYCTDSVADSVNMTNVCYSVFQIWQCYNCKYMNSEFNIPQYETYSTNYYPIEICDSCYTLIENIRGHCVGWHCASTGNNTLCRQTYIKDCDFSSDYPVPAYSDHPNGIETLIENSVLTSVGLGVLGKLIGCRITPTGNDSMLRINLDVCSIDGLAKYTISNCEFYPVSNGISDISIYCYPQASGREYDYFFDNLIVKNCINRGNKDIQIINRKSADVTGTINIDNINVINSNVKINIDASNKLYLYINTLNQGF